MKENNLDECYKNPGVLNKILRRWSINKSDIVFRDDEYIGWWDTKNERLISPRRSKVRVICSLCGRANIIPYRVWKLKKEQNKNICSNCSRSSTLSNLNKTVIKEKNLNFWSSEEGKSLREKFREARILYNKNELKNINLKKSYKEKEIICNKKRITWFSRPIEDRNKITEKRLNGSFKGIEEKSGLRYDSSYEKFFIERCIEAGLNISRGPKILYYDSEEKVLRTYFCDFIVANYLIEIKSRWTIKTLAQAKIDAAKSYAKEFGHKGFMVVIIRKQMLQEGLLDLKCFQK